MLIRKFSPCFYLQIKPQENNSLTPERLKKADQEISVEFSPQSRTPTFGNAGLSFMISLEKFIKLICFLSIDLFVPSTILLICHKRSLSLHKSSLQNGGSMTSPKKSLEVQKESTLFGELSHIEKQTTRMSKQLLEEIQTIKRLQADFTGVEKQAKFNTEDSKVKLGVQVKVFQQKIKAYLSLQKAQYMRLAGQINQLVVNNKQINSQLIVLQSRFHEFQKNVGI